MNETAVEKRQLLKHLRYPLLIKSMPMKYKQATDIKNCRAVEVSETLVGSTETATKCTLTVGISLEAMEIQKFQKVHPMFCLSRVIII